MIEHTPIFVAPGIAELPPQPIKAPAVEASANPTYVLHDEQIDQIHRMPRGHLEGLAQPSIPLREGGVFSALRAAACQELAERNKKSRSGNFQHGLLKAEDVPFSV